MFSIKCQEVVDKNTGVHLAFGDHGKDKSTVWVRISTRVYDVYKITTVMLHRDGDVISITPAQVAGQVVVEPENPAEFVGDEEIGETEEGELRNPKGKRKK